MDVSGAFRSITELFIMSAFGAWHFPRGDGGAGLATELLEPPVVLMRFLFLRERVFADRTHFGLNKRPPPGYEWLISRHSFSDSVKFFSGDFESFLHSSVGAGLTLLQNNPCVSGAHV